MTDFVWTVAILAVIETGWAAGRFMFAGRMAGEENDRFIFGFHGATWAIVFVWANILLWSKQ